MPITQPASRSTGSDSGTRSWYAGSVGRCEAKHVFSTSIAHLDTSCVCTVSCYSSRSVVKRSLSCFSVPLLLISVVFVSFQLSAWICERFPANCLAQLQSSENEDLQLQLFNCSIVSSQWRWAVGHWKRTRPFVWERAPLLVTFCWPKTQLLEPCSAAALNHQTLRWWGKWHMAEMSGQGI